MKNKMILPTMAACVEETYQGPSLRIER